MSGNIAKPAIMKSEEIAEASTYNIGQCMARVFGNGKGGQCKDPKKDGLDFCRMHARHWI